MRSILTLVIASLLASVSVYAQSSNGWWYYQIDNEPQVYESSSWAYYHIDAAGLHITFVLDSSQTSYRYMTFDVRGYEGVGGYGLDTTTVFQVANGVDNLYKNQDGGLEITEVDTDAGTITGTFNWYGWVQRQSGGNSSISVSNGGFVLYERANIELEIDPGNGAVYQPGDTAEITIRARDLGNKHEYLSDVNISLTHDQQAFGGTRSNTLATDATGTVKFFKIVKPDAPVGEYTYEIRANGTNVNSPEMVTQNFFVEVPQTTPQYYYALCDGEPFVEFDAGTGSEWVDEGNGRFSATSANILIAGMIRVDGTIHIDSAGGVTTVTGNGKMWYPRVMIGGQIQPFYLNEGDIGFTIPNCVRGLALDDFQPTQLAGGRLTLYTVQFADEAPTTTKSYLNAEMNLGRKAHLGCVGDVPFGTTWEPIGTSDAIITFEFTRNGANTDMVATGDMANFSPSPLWCVRNATINYDGSGEGLTIDANTRNPLLSGADAAVIFRNGQLQGLQVELDPEGCTNVPGLAATCWKGGLINATDFSANEPVVGDVNAQFGPSASTGNDMFQLFLDAGFSGPTSAIQGNVSGNLLRNENASKANPFQGDLTGEIEMETTSKRSRMRGQGHMLHVGGPYFFTGRQAIQLGLQPVSYNAAMDGELTLPELTPAIISKLGLFGRFLARAGEVPLGPTRGVVSMKEGGARKMAFAFDLANVETPAGGNEDFYDALRSLGRGTLVVDVDLLPSGEAFSFESGYSEVAKGLFSIVQKGGGQTQATDEAFTIGDGTVSFAAIIESQSAGLPTALRAPSGTEYDDTNEPDGVRKTTSPDGLMTMWVVTDPEPGAWTLKAPNAVAGDTFSIQTVGALPTIQVESDIQGNNLIVDWLGENLPETGDVEIYLLEKETDSIGVLAGSAAIGVGTKTIALSDSTAPCKFHVMVSLANTTAVAFDTDVDELQNPTITLESPDLISVEGGIGDSLRVAWTKITDGRVAAVVIADAQADTIIAGAFNFEDSVVAGSLPPSVQHVIAYSVDKRGFKSCPVDVFDLTSAVENGENTTLNGVTISVRPHPITSDARIDVVGLMDAPCTLQLVDVRGLPVMQPMHLTAVNGIMSTMIHTDALPAGMYVAVVRQSQHMISQGVIVTH